MMRESIPPSGLALLRELWNAIPGGEHARQNENLLSNMVGVCGEPFGSVDRDSVSVTPSGTKDLRDDGKSEVPVLVPSDSQGSSLPISDPDLARLIVLWPRLPMAIKAGITAIVQATGIESATAEQ